MQITSEQIIQKIERLRSQKEVHKTRRQLNNTGNTVFFSDELIIDDIHIVINHISNFKCFGELVHIFIGNIKIKSISDEDKKIIIESLTSKKLEVTEEDILKYINS